MTTDADNLLAQRRELMDKIEEQIDERGRIIERIQSAPDTPIARLRALHAQECGCKCICGECPPPESPCDLIAALDALEDPRPRLPWRCTGCGAKADEVQWAAIDSIYYEGHTVGISEPDICGPFRMPGDETEPLREENKQLQARIDAATVLIWGAQMDEHMNHGASLKRAALRACEHPNCAPYRAWLAGDKEEHSDRG